MATISLTLSTVTSRLIVAAWPGAPVLVVGPLFGYPVAMAHRRWADLKAEMLARLTPQEREEWDRGYEDARQEMLAEVAIWEDDSMTGEKVVQVVKNYRSEISTYDIPIEHAEHLIAMTDKIVGFVNEKRLGKAMRWLGFMQGTLWAHGIYTIEELADHNRPVPPGGISAPE